MKLYNSIELYKAPAGLYFCRNSDSDSDSCSVIEKLDNGRMECILALGNELTWPCADEERFFGPIEFPEF